jgi:hypothetical protein
MLDARASDPRPRARAPGTLTQVDIRLVVPVVLALLGCVYIAGSKNGSSGGSSGSFGGGGGVRAFPPDRLDAMIEARVAEEVKQQLDHKMRLMSAGADATLKPASAPRGFGEQKQLYKQPGRKMRVLVRPCSGRATPVLALWLALSVVSWSNAHGTRAGDRRGGLCGIASGRPPHGARPRGPGFPVAHCYVAHLSRHLAQLPSVSVCLPASKREGDARRRSCS